MGLSILKKTLQAVRELFDPAFSRDHYFILLNTFTLSVKRLPKRSLFSLGYKFYHTQIIKDTLEFENAIDFLAKKVRQAVVDLIKELQKELATAANHREEAKRLQTIFNEIHLEFQTLQTDQEQGPLSKKNISEIETTIKKGETKLINPLLAYLNLTDLWSQEVEAKMQDIFVKDLDVKMAFLKESGLILVKLISEKKSAGMWAHHLDIEGKNTLFQEMADTIFQSILKDPQKKHQKGVEELKLFRAYVNLLKNPKESVQFLSSMREAFLTKYQESIDRAEGVEDLYKLHQQKLEFERKALLLKLKREERQQRLEILQNRMEELKEDVPDKRSELLLKLKQTVIWPESSLKEFQNDFSKLVEAILLVISEESPGNLYGPLLSLGEDLHRKIASEISSRKKDLLDIHQSVENYSDRLRNELELQQLEEAIKSHGTESFISSLIKNKGERRSVIKEPEIKKEIRVDALNIFNRSKELVTTLARQLKINKDPLYITKEDLESAFFSLTAPYMTEGMQGKLPDELMQLKEEVAKGIKSIEEIEVSPFLGLAREQERVRTIITECEAVLTPLDEILAFLRACQDKEKKKKEFIHLMKEKKAGEERLERIGSEKESVEKELSVLEGVEAVLVELILLNA